MNPVSKILITIGTVFILAGLAWHFLGRPLGLGRLPGDVVIEKENFRFYFPWVSSILVSIVLSLILYLIRFFQK